MTPILAPLQQRLSTLSGADVWQKVKVKYLAKRIGSGKTPRGGSEVYVPSGVLFIRSMNVYDDGLRLDDVVYIDDATDHEMSQTRVLPADVLLNITGASIGRTCIVPTDLPPANVNQHVCIIRLNQQANPAFVSYALKSSLIKDQIRALENGSSREGLNFEQVGNLTIQLPGSLEQQRAIAAFLDRKTAEIDAVIAKKERLIALLQEERQALISRAVTRGLDAGVAMKDSGIEWLGKVPEHWNVRRVGSFCRVVRGASPRPAGDPRYFNGDAIPWITVAEITKDDGKYLESTETCLTPEGQELSRTLPSGTFVLTNSGATLGVPKILKISGCINDGSVAFFDLHGSVSKDFLYYYFTSQTRQLRERMNQGMGQPNLNTDLVRNIDVPFPPTVEQSRISSFLDRECKRNQDLVGLSQVQIEKLREYRQALISAAVTGKISALMEDV